ncbi:MAG: c-type cytochrome [Thermoanaerobaculia bacterium]
MALAFSACRGDGDLPPSYRKTRVPEERLASAESRARGRRIFLEHCALCHGTRADGRGVRREGLSTPPRDFTDPNTRRALSPRRMFFVIREGVRGTAMPSWKSLDEETAWDLVAYLNSVAPGAP